MPEMPNDLPGLITYSAITLMGFIAVWLRSKAENVKTHKKIDKANDGIGSVRTQVENKHTTNLRDEIDILTAGMMKVNELLVIFGERLSTHAIQLSEMSKTLNSFRTEMKTNQEIQRDLEARVNDCRHNKSHEHCPKCGY